MHKTKRKIFEKAMELFATKGYDSTSIEEITAVAGIAKGTFYYHFQKKEDIFFFLVEEGGKLLINSVELRIKKADNSIEKIKEIILVQIKVIIKYENFVRIILGDMWGNGERNKACKKCIENYLFKIKNVVEEGMSKGEIKKGNPEVTAYVIYSVICSCLMYKGKEELTINELYKEYTDYILKLLKN
jgi:TetR/AcrR family transcriptional regulator